MKYVLLLSLIVGALAINSWPKHYVSYRAFINVPDSTMPNRFRSVLDTTPIAIELDSANKRVMIGNQVYNADEISHLDTNGICGIQFLYHQGFRDWWAIIAQHALKEGWGWKERVTYTAGSKLSSVYYMKPVSALVFQQRVGEAKRQEDSILWAYKIAHPIDSLFLGHGWAYRYDLLGPWYEGLYEYGPIMSW